MKVTRFSVAAGGLLAATVVGVLWLAPTTHGQVVITGGQGEGRSVFIGREEPQGVVRRVEILTGRGSSLGVTVREVEESDVSTMKLPSRHGAIIEDVDDESPAAKAGFERNDVVVSFDGETVRSARQFSRLVEETPAGRSVKAAVVRKGSRIDVDVTVGRSQPMRVARGGDGPRHETFRWERGFPAMPDLRALEDLPDIHMEIERSAGQGTLGVGVQAMTEELAAYFGAKDGLLVNTVRADSPAARAGLKPGDVITSFNGKAVESASELRRELREAEAAEVTIEIVRDKQPLSIKATLEKSERSSRRRWPV